mgnify:CR=1 FL=1
MKYIKYIALAGLVGLTSSCIDDLLNRPATTEVSSDLFWTSTDDALSYLRCLQRSADFVCN